MAVPHNVERRLQFRSDGVALDQDARDWNCEWLFISFLVFFNLCFGRNAELGHELELWKLTRSEDHHQSAQRTVVSLTQALAQSPTTWPTLPKALAKPPADPPASSQRLHPFVTEPNWVATSKLSGLQPAGKT